MVYTSSRGWRNNNPLNIRKGDKWQGLVAKQNETDPVFCQFITQTHGYRAAAKVLRSYYRLFRQEGIPWALHTILNRWAPPTENHTADYLWRVMDIMGMERGDTTTLPPLNTPNGVYRLGQLMAAMTCVECGCTPAQVNYENINAAMAMTTLGSPNLDKNWWK